MDGVLAPVMLPGSPCWGNSWVGKGSAELLVVPFLEHPPLSHRALGMLWAQTYLFHQENADFQH